MSDKVVQLIHQRERAHGRDGGTSAGGGGDHMEPRIARLEAGMEHLTREISELRTDVRDLRSDVRTDFRTTFGALITVALGLAALMAKGFGWL